MQRFSCLWREKSKTLYTGALSWITDPKHEDLSDEDERLERADAKK